MLMFIIQNTRIYIYDCMYVMEWNGTEWDRMEWNVMQCNVVYIYIIYVCKAIGSLNRYWFL